MNQSTSLSHRFAGLVLACGLALGALLVTAPAEVHQQTGQTEQTDEVAGATWSRWANDPGKGGVGTRGATWS